MTAEMKPDTSIATRVTPGAGRGSNDFTLLVLTGLAVGQTVAVDRKVRVGKAADNDLVLPDDTVSRHHCELERRGECVFVKDLGSTNGTRIAGSKITEALAPPGSILRFGEVEVVVRATPQKVDVMPSAEPKFGPAIGESLAMRTVFGMLERIAPTDGTVLLEGETGTGKDVLAESLHEASARANGPFVVFDCAAIPPPLIESALFGHERGAFTGASSARRGAFEEADGGTLFLDELGELPVDVQPKLLRAVETSSVQRVGANAWTRVSVRVLAATRRDLDREVQEGRFREDLFYRLAVGRIELPPLRRRQGDVTLLARHFWRELGGRDAPLPPSLAARLEGWHWPGNVRELENTVARYLAIGDLELSHDLSPGIDNVFERVLAQDLPLLRARERVLEAFERCYIERVLARFGGNVSRAAASSGLARRYFQILRARYAIKRT
jgi:transcriptional regulator with GAF, ATPase, and Fis domain